MGNIDSKRDWGHARDYVDAMWRILQQDKPEDFVIATGVTTPVREFVEMAFKELGITLAFSGEGIDEKGFVLECTNPEYSLPVGKQVIAVDPAYFRPTEVELLIGDATKARTKLGWKPTFTLDALVRDMVENDVKLIKSYGVDYVYSYADAV
jgi:GDPmannose 4,6-dehydratase